MGREGVPASPWGNESSDRRGRNENGKGDGPDDNLWEAIAQPILCA